LSSWSGQWFVSFNPNKTEAILFSNQNINTPALVFDYVNIYFVDNHKHLGLTLSQNGKWKNHIESVTASPQKNIRNNEITEI